MESFEIESAECFNSKTWRKVKREKRNIMKHNLETCKVFLIMSVSFQNTVRIWRTVVISLPSKRSGLGLKPRTTRAQDMAWPWLDFLISFINLG